ncbi:MAG TPA: hypothetical protein PK413_08580 [Thermoanaerobaculia bacterium]|nr:hypothetical protein [Thermoanaerobaculia bacterium]
MNKRTEVLTLAILLIAGLAVAGPASAVPAVNPGIDLWETQPGTVIDFSDNPLPAGFFPGCPSPFAGQVPVSGDPIAADKALGTSDTILQRTGIINFDATGKGSTTLVMAALCVKNGGWVDPCGRTWTVKARLSAVQAPGSITAVVTSASGGSFTADFTVKADVIFTSGATSLTTTDSLRMVTTGGAWQYAPPAGAVVVSGNVNVDSNCDGALDKVLPGTSNFFPTAATHSGPHPTKPPKPCNVQPASPRNAVPAPAPTPIKCAVIEVPAEPAN